MRTRLVVSLVVATMMLVGACGGDSDGEAESGESDGAGSSSAAPPSAADDGAGSASDPAPSVDDPDEGSDAGSDQGEAEAGSSAGPSTDSGAVFAVDGESFGGDVFNCDPSDGAGDASPGDLDLVVLSGPGEGLSIDVWHADGRASDGTAFPQMNVEVRFNRTTDVVEQYDSDFDHDADGNWTADSDPSVTLDGPPITVDGNRIMGDVTLSQTVPRDVTGAVQVAFDFEIPQLSC